MQLALQGHRGFKAYLVLKELSVSVIPGLWVLKAVQELQALKVL